MSQKRKFTDYEKKFVYNKYNGICSICGKQVSKNKMTISHKTPLSKGGTHAFDNLMLTCRSCSLMKHDLEEQEFLVKIHEVYCYNKEFIERRKQI